VFSRAYKAAITIPPLAWVTLFLLVPYLLMFCYSFWAVASGNVVHQWNLGNYHDLLTKGVYRQTLLRSLWIAARVTAFALLLDIRWHISCRSMPGRERTCSISW